MRRYAVEPKEPNICHTGYSWDEQVSCNRCGTVYVIAFSREFGCTGPSGNDGCPNCDWADYEMLGEAPEPDPPEREDR